MGTEQDVDERAFWQAADRYAELRRRSWMANIYGVSIGIVGTLLAELLKDLEFDALRWIVGLITVVGFLGGLGTATVTGLQLSEFRCPRCRKFFAHNAWGFRPGNQCRHCGLDLGPGRPKVVDLPRGEEYEWKRDYPGRDPGGA